MSIIYREHDLNQLTINSNLLYSDSTLRHPTGVLKVWIYSWDKNLTWRHSSFLQTTLSTAGHVQEILKRTLLPLFKFPSIFEIKIIFSSVVYISKLIKILVITTGGLNISEGTWCSWGVVCFPWSGSVTFWIKLHRIIAACTGFLILWWELHNSLEKERHDTVNNTRILQISAGYRVDKGQ
jgi:hypothetical protein